MTGTLDLRRSKICPTIPTTTQRNLNALRRPSLSLAPIVPYSPSIWVQVLGLWECLTTLSVLDFHRLSPMFLNCFVLAIVVKMVPLPKVQTWSRPQPSLTAWHTQTAHLAFQKRFSSLSSNSALVDGLRISRYGRRRGWRRSICSKSRAAYGLVSRNSPK